MAENIYPSKSIITKKERRDYNHHHSSVIWITGLSGAGKSTIAYSLENILFQRGIRCYVLDGDNMRTGLNKDLDFSEEGRTENIRRIGEVSKLFVDSGIFVISAFISPLKKDREICRSLVSEKEFIEVYVDCPLSVCEERDIKGLYKRARNGEIPNFTGIDSPYEPPESPEITVKTHEEDIHESIQKILNYLYEHEFIKQTAVAI